MALVAGLDLGSRMLRLAVVRTGLGPPEVVRLEEEDATVEGALATLVAKLPPGVDAIHASLPGDTLSSRLMDIPAAAGRKAEQVLAFELDGLLPFELDSAVFHHQTAPGAPAGKIRMLAVAAPATNVEEYLARFRAVGVDPRVLSAGGLPLADLVPQPDRRKRALGPPPAPMVLLDIGHERTDVVGIVEGRPIFVRTVSHGGSDVTAAIAKAFNVPPDRAEAFKHAQATLGPPPPGAPEGSARLAEVARAATEPLLRDLRQSMAALTTSTGTTPVAIALAGGGARLSGLPEMLEAALRVPVANLDPPKLKEPIDAERFTVFAKALGLALRAAAKAPRVDLRRGSFAVQADARALRGRIVATAALFSVVVLAWGFSAVSRYTVLQHEADKQRESLRAVTKELLGEEITDFGQAAALAKGTAESGDPMPQMDAFAALDTISRKIPAEIQHDIDEIEIAPERLEIRGLVDSLADVDRVFQAVSEEPCFPVVNRGKTTRSAADGRQKYQLDIEIRCPTAAEEAEGEQASGPTRPERPTRGSE